VRSLSTFVRSFGVLVLAGCASGASHRSSTSRAAPSASPDAGEVSTDAGTSTERPFANSTAEATTMIAEAVDSKGRDVAACVRDFRARKKLLHDKVSVSFGIDQEGTLLGVTSKGKEDAELKTCVQQALTGARFPRSRAGVITITKTYEERLQ
jgi:hypothetical protein